MPKKLAAINKSPQQPCSDLLLTPTEVAAPVSYGWPHALDLKQASQYSSIKIFTLRHAIWAGTLRARLSGKHFLILRDDMDAYLKQLPRVRSGKRVNTRKAAA